MHVEKIAFKNMLGKPMEIVIEPVLEYIDLPVEGTAYFHLLHDSDDFQDPLDIHMHSDGQLIVFEQRQNMLEVYIEARLVYSTDINNRIWAKKPIS